MPKTFPSEDYYDVVNDSAVPGSNKKNIILTESGMIEIAKHYKEKYNVDMQVYSSSMDSGAKILADLIEKEKKAKSGIETFRTGFVFLKTGSGKHGHAMPIIYEKNKDKERVFFLDSGQLLGSNQDKLGQGKNFRKKLNDEMPHLELWSQFSNRQIDLSSCTTDSMVTLKDGLRLSPSLGEVAEQKFMKTEAGVNFFYMPEELLKTAQIGSFVEKSKADLDKEMHKHRIKDSSGKTTGEIMVTLRDFRKKHDISVTRKGAVKTVGLYTIQKGERYAEILRNRWEKEQQADIKLFLAMLSKRQFNQKKGYTSENRENFLASIQKETKDGETNSDSIKNLIKMCDYLGMVRDDKNSNVEYGSQTVTDAKKVEKLLLSMLTDENHPNLKANLEQLKPSMFSHRYSDALNYAKELCKRADAIIANNQLLQSNPILTARHINLINMLAEGQAEIGQPLSNLLTDNFLIDRISVNTDKAKDNLADICQAIMMASENSIEKKMSDKATAAMNFLALRALNEPKPTLRENLQFVAEKYKSAKTNADVMKCSGANQIINCMEKISKELELKSSSQLSNAVRLENTSNNETEVQPTRRMSR